MRQIIIATFAALALAGCSQTERQDAGNDVEAAADTIGDKTREVVTSPQMKEVGAEIKEAAGDVVKVAKGAASGAKDAAGKVAAENEASASREDRTTTETTTTTVTKKN